MTQPKEETNFANDLALENLLKHDPSKSQEVEEEEDAQAEAEKKADPFDDPPPRKKAQRNWLEHGLTEKVSMKKAKRGRPLGSLDKKITKASATKEAIAMLTAAGVTKTAMAQILGMSTNRLNKDFAHELEYGADMLKTRIVNAIVKKALDGNMTAALFFMKAKGGWREANPNDPQDGEKRALSDVERNQRLMSLLMTNPEFKVMMGQKLLESKPIDITPETEQDVFDI